MQHLLVKKLISVRYYVRRTRGQENVSVSSSDPLNERYLDFPYSGCVFCVFPDQTHDGDSAFYAMPDKVLAASNAERLAAMDGWTYIFSVV